MRIARIVIKNFRGISNASIHLFGHSLLIGDNNAGKSTVFEAIDLVLGPDRLSRVPVIDEHDFFEGNYQAKDGIYPEIEIEIVVVDLDAEQVSRFKDYLEFWDERLECLLSSGEIDVVDDNDVQKALRVKFVGCYNADDDDFEGNTFFATTLGEGAIAVKFRKADKYQCGFLYLRALRTGSRALSMERGSLLDIIMKLKEVRPKMWENVLEQLRDTEVATDPELGIKGILEGVQEALKEFVPSDWGSEPLLKVSDLTREQLRRTLTVFMSTGPGSYHAPFQHQGTGTINTLVLALLAMIAEARKNVIFAMEEPEIAIPPYTQKRIIHSIIQKTTQAIFTSHSPFVLEEFPPDQIILLSRDSAGIMKSKRVYFPKMIKPKLYLQEFRLRFAEALLAKRVLLTEGSTEASSYAAAGRRLNEIAPEKYQSLEGLGIAVFDVKSETAVSIYGKYFRDMSKIVFAVFDKQSEAALKDIEDSVDHPFESQYKGFENLILEETNIEIIKEYHLLLVKAKEWPEHLRKFICKESDSDEDFIEATRHYLKDKKGAYAAAEIIGLCKVREDIPITIRKVIVKITRLFDSK